MKGKFTIFMLCATVVRISLAEPSDSPSEILSAALADLTRVEALEEIAISGSNKAIRELCTMAYLRNVVEDGVTENSTHTKRECIEKIANPWIRMWDATSGTTLTIDPQAFSTIETIQGVGHNAIRSICEDICSTIISARKKNSYKNLTEIDVFKAKHGSAAESFNLDFVAIFETNRTILRGINDVTETFKRKSTAALGTVARMSFAILITFPDENSVGSDVSIRDFNSFMTTTQNRLQLEHHAYIRLITNHCKTFIHAFYVIRIGAFISLSDIEPIERSAILNFNKPVNDRLVQCRRHLPKVCSKNQREILIKFCKIQADRRIALSALKKMPKGIFVIIENEYRRFSAKGGSACKVHSYDYDRVEIVIFRALKRSVGATLDAVKSATDESTNAQIFTGLKKIAAGLRSGIELIASKDSSKIQTVMKKIHSQVEEEAMGVGEKISSSIRKSQKAGSAIEPAIISVHADIIHELKTGFHNLIITITILLGTIFPNINFGIDCSPSALATAKNNTFSEFDTAIDFRFIMIETVLVANSCDNNSGLLEKLSTLQSSHGKRISLISDALSTIFSMIEKFLDKVPREDHNMSEDDRRDLKTFSEEISSSFTAAIDSVMDLISSMNPETKSAVESNRHAAHRSNSVALDGIIDAIKLFHGNSSSGIENKFHSHRDATISNATKAVANIHLAIKNSGMYPARTRASIDRTIRKVISIVVEIFSAVFEAIAIFLRKAFPGIKLGNEDKLSTIKDAREKALLAVRELIKRHTMLLQIVIIASFLEQAGLTDEVCSARTTWL